MGHISAKAIGYLLKNTKNTDLQGSHVTSKKSIISNQKITKSTTQNKNQLNKSLYNNLNTTISSGLNLALSNLSKTNEKIWQPNLQGNH